MDDIKISVIVPVYNVEKYINQCIESVLKQTYKNIEVILVDDGSPDNCPEIIDIYAINDSRVKVIHKNNGGLSSARNSGIRVASGDYLTFLDSDDYWDDITAIETLVDQIDDFYADVISWGYKKYYEGTGIYKENDLSVQRDLLLNVKKEDALFNLVKHNCYIASAWNKLVKKELFNNNDLFFVEGILSEDIDWCARLALYANSFDVFNNSFYVYRQREGSITKNISETNIFDLENNIGVCLRALSPEASTLLNKSYYAFTADQYANYLICLNYIREDRCFEKHFQFAQKHKFLLGYGLSTRVRLINIFSKLIGLKQTIRLLGNMAKFK